MAQVEVRLSRKPYSRGESTDARINREIQMASLCTCSVGEINTKLVSRMRLVTPHMVRATNMRMIICFMIFLASGGPLGPGRSIRGEFVALEGDASSSELYVIATWTFRSSSPEGTRSHCAPILQRRGGGRPCDSRVVTAQSLHPVRADREPASGLICFGQALSRPAFRHLRLIVRFCRGSYGNASAPG